MPASQLLSVTEEAIILVHLLVDRGLTTIELHCPSAQAASARHLGAADETAAAAGVGAVRSGSPFLRFSAALEVPARDDRKSSPTVSYRSNRRAASARSASFANSFPSRMSYHAKRKRSSSTILYVRVIIHFKRINPVFPLKLY